MEVPSFLLMLFHGICYLCCGILLGYNSAVHMVSKKLKLPVKYYYTKYFVVIVLLVFLVWVLYITDGGPKGISLPLILGAIGTFFAIKIYVTKCWDKYYYSLSEKDRNALSEKYRNYRFM
jgi:hypothetical protein